jgi:hypothetical protein
MIIRFVIFIDDALRAVCQTILSAKRRPEESSYV